MLFVDGPVMVGDDIDIFGEAGNHDAVGTVAFVVELDALHDSWNEVVDTACVHV